MNTNRKHVFFSLYLKASWHLISEKQDKRAWRQKRWQKWIYKQITECKIRVYLGVLFKFFTMIDNWSILLTSVNVLLHTICLLLLVNIYRKENEHKPQPLYLINLSFTELTQNLHNLFYIFHWYSSTRKMRSLYTIDCMPFMVMYNISLFLLTADRLCAGLLNLRYKAVCTVYRVKVAILCSWCFSLLVIPSIFVPIYEIYGYKTIPKAIRIFFDFVDPAIRLCNFLFITTTYIIVFVIFVRSRRRVEAGRSIFNIFVRSNFSVALLIVSTWILLTVIPFFTVYILFLTKFTIIAQPKMIIHVATLLNFFSDTVDAIIYIVIYPPVWNLLKTTTKTLFLRSIRRDRGRATTQTSEHSIEGRLATVISQSSRTDEAVTDTRL